MEEQSWLLACLVGMSVAAFEGEKEAAVREL